MEYLGAVMTAKYVIGREDILVLVISQENLPPLWLLSPWGENQFVMLPLHTEH